MTYRPFALAERIEDALGDPADEGNVFSVSRCLELDGREEFPEDICAHLDKLGLPRFYVPVGHGGDLDTYENLLQVIRTLSRRDFTVALAHCKTYLGSVATWVAGTPGQAEDLARRVLRGEVVSLALTERDHGSDVLAGRVSATPSGAGYRIDGEKWLINNATRGDLVCVLARTGPRSEARCHSLFLVDKHRLPSGGYHHLPKVRTHGVRGADISGIHFTGAEVPADAMIGEPGAGLEILLKGLQITRTLCGGMSLGMGEHALRFVAGFAERHRMFGRPLIELPQTARVLAESYADLMVAEAVTLVSTRAIHTLTAEQSVISAVVKYYVPTIVDRAVNRLAKVLGARALLTDGPFQKLQRDHRIVGIFDGNTLVNLNAVVNQFSGLVRGYRRERVDHDGLDVAAGLDLAVPAFEPDRLSLLSRGGCSLVQDLPARTGAAMDAAPEHLGRLRRYADGLHAELARCRPVARDVPPEMFDLARRYAAGYAAAACLRMWADNGLDTLWLRVCLARVLGGRDEAADRLLPVLRERLDDRRPLSLLAYRSTH
ncbi:acyl-CoA dehydrogenase family protein [Streptosporangium sp. NPDC049376]|uniref:acyl-CoA dehydrogenase family protein n=1 Tax=Streptosporangium sp. NPDC049376 TaxID=3366192 RepID=UPI0037A40747